MNRHAEKINIAHVIYSFGTGGIENGIVNLVNHLDPEKYMHTIVCLAQSGEFSERIRGGNCSIIELNKKSGTDWSLPSRLARIFKKNNINIVHLRGWPTLIEGVLGAKLARVKKVLYGFHGKTIQDISEKNRKRQFAEILAVRFVDKIVTLSEVMEADFRNYVKTSSSKMHIIYNGVDTDKFKKKVSDSKIRNEMLISKDDFVVGSVGRLDRVKDFSTLIQAFAFFVRQNPGSKLLIVGDGPEKAALEQLSREKRIAEHVIFVGYRKDVAQMMRVMDIYVQTSLYEGFSNTIIEAMAVGLPIIATDVGGNAVLIVENVNGFLIKTQDPKNLYEKILELREKEMEMQIISKNNRMRAIQVFSIENMIQNYDRFYSRVINQRHA